MTSPSHPPGGTGHDVLRVANGSGFYGDRHEAMLELVEGGPVDVLTGDYLAELTMLILWRNRQRDPDRGYARSFVRQARQILAPCLDRGTRIVVNAGGLNPAGLARALRELAAELGLAPRIAHVTGDDLLPRLDDLTADGHRLAHLVDGTPLAAATAPAVTANAYLGGFGIAAALEQGADVVVTGRVTDASLTVGPAAWHFGWGRGDLDRLAGATVAGHVIECGAQATGGNHPADDLDEPDDHPVLPGFPIAELAADGSAVITKHPGTGGRVTVSTVTAQLLYEIGPPRYLGPDVTARFDTVEVASAGPDRVRIAGTRGEPPPSTAKVAITTFGGWRNTVTFVLTGREIEAKEALLRRQVAAVVDLAAIDRVEWHHGRRGDPDAPRNEDATSTLSLIVTDPAPEPVSRHAFADAIVGLALSSYAGFTLTAPPAAPTPIGRWWPALIDAQVLTESVVVDDDPPITLRPTAVGHPTSDGASDAASGRPQGSVAPARTAAADVLAGLGPFVDAPLGSLVRARSGDKGGDANIGIWVSEDAHLDWLLARFAAPADVHELLPETVGLDVDIHPLPNLRAVNVVVHGLLGDGVAGSTRPDPQAKGLAEYLRGRTTALPARWVDPAPGT
jgi:hypothetical protein